jgi:hypothetical protein
MESGDDSGRSEELSEISMESESPKKKPGMEKAEAQGPEEPQAKKEESRAGAQEAFQEPESPAEEET